MECWNPEEENTNNTADLELTIYRTCEAIRDKSIDLLVEYLKTDNPNKENCILPLIKVAVAELEKEFKNVE